MNIVKKIKAYLQFRQAVRMAEEAHAENGTRYYIMPSVQKGKPVLIIINKKNFKGLKRKGYIPREASMPNLTRECFYFTERFSSDDAMHPDVAKQKREEFYKWHAAVSKQNK